MGNYVGKHNAGGTAGPGRIKPLLLTILAALVGLSASGFDVAMPFSEAVDARTIPRTDIAASSSFMVDPYGLVPFERVIVDTIAADGTRKRNVASHGLERPPAGKLLAPLEVLNRSSAFGLRSSPISGAAGEFHYGQDFAAGCGTRVYSSDAGVARAVGWHLWGGGNRVEVDHGNGLITTYNHLESSTIEQGETVDVGEVIARVGTTGSSTGCHLHFESIVKGVHTDPDNWDFLPISQLVQLDDLPRLNFEPGRGVRAARAPVWAVPVTEAVDRSVTGGDHEGRVTEPPSPEKPSPSTAPPKPPEPDPPVLPPVSPDPPPVVPPGP